MTDESVKTFSQPLLREWKWDAILVCVMLFVYIASSYSGPGGSVSAGDSAKFQFAAGTLSAPHSPGFPVYIISGWIWTHCLPFLSTATAVSLLSAVFMCGALLFFRRALRIFEIPPLAATLVACSTGILPTLWRAATEAGPATCGLFFAAAALLILLRRYHYKDDRFAGVSIALMIVAGSIILTWAWAVPVLFVWVLIVQRQSAKSFRFWCGIAAGTLFVIAAYSVFYYRSHTGAPLLEYIGHNASISRMLQYISGAQFHANWWVVNKPADFFMRLQFITKFAADEFFIVGAVLFLIGWIVLWYRAKTVAFLFLLLLIALVASVIHLYVPDKLHFLQLLIPCFFISMYLCGISLTVIKNKSTGISYIVAGLLLISILFWNVIHSPGLFTRGGEWNIERHLLAIPNGSTLVTDDMYAMQEVLRYYKNENEYIKRRNIRLSDNIQTGSSVTNFFLSRGIKAQLDEMEIGYFQVYSNETAILHAVGIAQEAPERNDEK